MCSCTSTRKCNFTQTHRQGGVCAHKTSRDNFSLDILKRYGDTKERDHLQTINFGITRSRQNFLRARIAGSQAWKVAYINSLRVRVASFPELDVVSKDAMYFSLLRNSKVILLR